MTDAGDEASQDPRIAAIHNAWVPYPAANEIKQTMERLIKAQAETRPECLAIIGDPNYGKSELFKSFARKHEQPYDPNVDSPPLPVVLIEMPEDATPSAFVRTLIQATGAPVDRREPLDILCNRLKVLLHALKTRLILVDEFHNGFEGTHRQQRQMLNLARGISNRTSLPLVVAGVDTVDNFIRNDKQLDQRFRRIKLPQWKEDDSTRRLLKAFEEAFRLKQPSRLGSPAMTKVVVELTEGRLGNISRLLKFSAIEAIHNRSEQISIELLARMAKQLPSEDAAVAANRMLSPQGAAAA